MTSHVKDVELLGSISSLARPCNRQLEAIETTSSLSKGSELLILKFQDVVNSRCEGVGEFRLFTTDCRLREGRARSH